MGGTPIRQSFEPFLRDKGKGPSGQGGNYRRVVEGELNRFALWCAGDTHTLSQDHDREVVDSWSGIYPESKTQDRPPCIADIETQFEQEQHNIFRSYARHLRRQGYKSSTARRYFSFVSSWNGWCVQEGRFEITRHLANMAGAKEPLEDVGTHSQQDQQIWSPAQRDALVGLLDQEVRDALDERAAESPDIALAQADSDADQEVVEIAADDRSQAAKEQAKYEALKPYRDRALISLIAYSAVRGAEVLRDPQDPRRDGVRWADLSLDDNSFEVLRKRQVRTDASLPSPAVSPLSQWRTVLSPPSDEWPIFPTLHYPTVAEHVIEGLSKRGYSSDEVAEIRDSHNKDFFVALEYDIPLPSSTTAGLRSRLKRLCDDHRDDIPDLGPEEYLKPHGARRSMGELLVREEGFAAAARFLDNSEKVVRKHYSHIKAAEQADTVTTALAQTDTNVAEQTDDKKTN